MARRQRPGPRRPRARRPRGESVVGRRFEVEVGPVAHGGHCVARVDGRAVFVRHALPGERVLVEVTEGSSSDRFWRADAVQVREPSPDRVAGPCPVAGPGLCGGCDFQHVAVPAQRRLKADVVREQLVRLGGLAPDDPLVAGLRVEAVPVPGADVDDGLRWRTRTRFVRTPDGHPGLRRHRSHDVVAVEDCLITAEEAQPGRPRARGIVTEHVVVGPVAHDLARAADGFWQVHPAAPTTLVSAVLDGLDPQPGESVLDLYAGVGLFASFLADRVGAGARVALVEGDPAAAGHARTNLPSAAVAAGDVAAALAAVPCELVDLVVLDPPRVGARRAVVEQVVARSPRAVAYVACDPAALARDLAHFADGGYRPVSLRAFDLFPMTHHVECVAVLHR